MSDTEQTPKSRAPEAIQLDYNNLCAQAGELSLRREQIKAELGRIFSRIDTLNTEMKAALAAKAAQEEKDKEAVALKKGGREDGSSGSN